MSVRAIETEYKGYRFRSRLEARWAVFFDALGIRYEYEREGFELPSGTRYLPDFFLPDINGGIYVEVKGQMDDSSYLKIVEFWEHGNAPLYVLGGIPTQDELDSDYIYGYVDRYKRCFEYGSHVSAPGWDWPYLFCVCPACGKVGLEFDGRGWRVCGNHSEVNLENSTYVDDSGVMRKLAYPEVAGWRSDDKGYSWNHRKLVNAYKKARSARFEFSERQ